MREKATSDRLSLGPQTGRHQNVGVNDGSHFERRRALLLKAFQRLLPLDPVAAADMRRYLGEQRARGAALIVTTHVLSEAELMADRIAIMRRGVVVTEGTLEDRIASLMAAKRDLAERVVGAGEGWIGELSNDDLSALVSLGRPA